MRGKRNFKLRSSSMNTRRHCPHDIAVWFLGLLAGFGLGLHSSPAAEAPGSTWVDLSTPADFNEWNEDHRGWVIAGDAALDSSDEKRLAPSPGKGVLVCQGDAANLESRRKFRDVHVKLEFMVPRGTNSGVKLNGLYEIQIRDSHGVEKPRGDDCGGVYPRAELNPRYRLLDAGFPPRENAAKQPGVWQTLEIRFTSPRLDGQKNKTANARFERVVLNGRVIHKNVELKWPTGHAWDSSEEVAQGPLLLQGDHGPIAFRNVRVRELADR